MKTCAARQAEQKARILVVDDDPINVRRVIETLGDERYEFETARDGVEAVEMVRTDPPDLLILDVMMPRMNGLEVCRIVKSLSSDSFVPIILVTVRSDLDSKITGLRVGADDYLAKPYNSLELKARVDSMLRIKGLQDKINAKRRQLETMSLTDDLTGLLNHRAFQQRLRDEFQRARRYNEPLSLLMIDIDQFKAVNEGHGHVFGDHVLSKVAKLMAAQVREIDVVARYGGEEFVVVLPQTHFSGSLAVADRVCRAVAEEEFGQASQSVRLSLSIGIAFFPNKNVTAAEELLAFAHEALGQAKSQGRNRICLHQHLNYLYRPEGNALDVDRG